MTRDQERLVMDNMGLVRHIVNRCFHPNGVQTWQDLFQCGCVGLVKAAAGYKPESGTKFSTYAWPVIWTTVSRYLIHDRIHNAPEVSYENTVPGAPGLKFKDVLENNTDYSEEAIIYAHTEHILDCCSKKERFILVKRASGYTLQEIGDIFGISRERIRQIEQKAKAKIAKELKAE
jgi:RNA polymerase sigma factor (sigma-70 family)